MESTVLVKAFALLEELARSQGPKPLAELAQAAGLTKPTAHRVLASLVSLGYVERRDGGRYRVSDKLRQLSGGTQQPQPMVELARGPMTKLHELTGETVNLGVLRGDRVLYLLTMESAHPLRRVVASSETDPFHCTALGRAMVAYLPTEHQERLLRSARLERRTPATLTDRNELRKMLLQTRTRGHAIEENQTDIGVMCIAAPILAGEGEARRAVAAVSLSVPVARAAGLRRKMLIDSVCATAAQVTRQIENQPGA